MTLIASSSRILGAAAATVVAPPTSAAPVVVVHCVELNGPRLERRLRAVLSTLPESTRVLATFLRRPMANLPSMRRVTPVVVRDGGEEVIRGLVATDALVIVVPVTAELSSGWYEEVEARTVGQPDFVGVVPLGEHHLFAFPRGVRDLEAPRHRWTAVAGLRKRTDGTPLKHRSLGAVLIVKDEEEALGACLAAVAPLVDELVVYDTGSSDGTREIVLAQGATLVEGFWDDDFAAARNRALSHATTDWILSLDADEVVEADVQLLRRWVDEADGDVALVDIVSTQWDGTREGHKSRSVRLFQRSGMAWRGALHEQVTATQEGAEVTPCTSLPPLTLFHSGYRSVEALSKDKRQRNLEISRVALERLDESDPAWADACIDYGRSLALATDLPGAVRVLNQMLEHPASPGQLVQAARAVTPYLIATGQLDCASEWVGRARVAGESPGQIAVWNAQMLAREGDVGAAVRMLEPLSASVEPCGSDVWGQVLHPTSVTFACAEIELSHGNAWAAYHRLLPALHESPEKVPLVLVLRALLTSGHTFADLAREAPKVFVQRSLREIFTACPDVALEWFSACRSVYPSDASVVVAGSIAAARTGVTEALDWSMHARQHGLDVCALRIMGADADIPLTGRMSAYALLLHGFLEGSAREPLELLLAEADQHAVGAALANLQQAAPELQSLLG